MRYVRTKDGHLLEIGKTTEYGFVAMPECKTAIHFVEDGQEFIDIIKQSDNILELFDEIIAHNHKTPHDVKDVFSITRELNYALDYMEDGYTIYGAVWTNIGLIYVARMKGILLNGKIDWELL